ncbi:hypothetical protein LTR86_011016 [Recurvomyces mirabilis]|nr:hypothetical protein LTR86_011016 [Recurvomyces mirabilis]
MSMTQPSDIPLWTGMYNDAIVSIEQYVGQRAGDKNVLKHMQDFVCFIKEYWDDVPGIDILVRTSYRCNDGQCQRMISQITWLAAFTNGQSDTSDALNALARQPNHCTRLLKRFLVVLANYVIMAEWKLEALDIIKGQETRTRLPLLEYTAKSVSGYVRWQRERQDMVVSSLWHSLERTVEACPLHQEYQMTSSKVANLCLLAGCPKTAPNPLDNVGLLREHLIPPSSESREAELRLEIEELRKQNRAQQRIITNLTFRHLLENLPPVSVKGMSVTARWTDFFKKALRTAQAQSQTSS